MTRYDLQQPSTDAEETIRALQAELAETNRGLIALSWELEQRVDERTTQLRAAHDELQRTNAELLQLTLDLEDRVAQRTEEIRRLNEELERRVVERTAELAAVNKELEAFTYSVAHDLRAPLRKVDGYCVLLLEDCPTQLDSVANRYLHLVRQGAQQMGRLVDDLLNLSKIGKKELYRRPTPLNSLIELVLNELAPQLSGREIQWQIAALPTVDCDPGLMKQVFVNLLDNAVKYTRPRERAVIQVSQMETDREQVISVRDNGVGFRMENADKLFGVFQRLHRQEEFEGTGVGLATVQRIIQKHGGRIWAEAEEEKGATFYFTLGKTT